MVQSCGLVTQWVLSETGERKEKSHMTNDLSFSITNSYASVNRQFNKKAYHELITGFCLLRISHFIVALRLRFPKTPILLVNTSFQMPTKESTIVRRQPSRQSLSSESKQILCFACLLVCQLIPKCGLILVRCYVIYQLKSP